MKCCAKGSHVRPSGNKFDDRKFITWRVLASVGHAQKRKKVNEMRDRFDMMEYSIMVASCKDF